MAKSAVDFSSASLFQEPPIPQIEIELDREKAARYGINMTDLQNVIQTGVGQFPVSTVYVGERTYPLTVRLIESARNSPGALSNLLVKTASGAQIPLSQIADIRLRSGESIVTREGRQRQLTIRVDNRDRDLTSYLAEAQALSHTGSFGWDLSSGEIYWSDETYRIFEIEPTSKPTVQMVLDRTHPDDQLYLR